jgi:uncharacterized coiled-coil protein SlyX
VKQTAPSEEQIKRYLLGDASADEQRLIEDEYFSEDAFFDEMLAIEDELIDAYVRGELSAREREQFERRFLVSERQRERIEFARRLQTSAPLAAASAARAGQDARPLRRSILALVEALGPAARFALAAVALVIALGGVWLAREALRVRERLAQAERERVALGERIAELERQIAEQRAAGDQARHQLQREQDERTRLERELAALKTAPEHARPAAAQPRLPLPAIVSFVLSPGLVRSGGPSNRLVIPAGARRVRLRLELESADYRSYRATLQTAEGDQVWSRGGLKAQETAAGQTISVNIPAHILAARDYILSLTGTTSQGTTERAGDYAFRVVKD